MSDQRPRPKYGEYAPLPSAAPDQQADAVDAAESSAQPASVQPASAPAQPASAQPGSTPPGSTPPAGATQKPTTTVVVGVGAAQRQRRLWDVMLTSTLLLFGVVDVITSFPTIANLGSLLREGLAAQGVGTFTADASAAEAGSIANIVRALVLAITIVFALLQIHRKRIAFWIPLVGAAVATIVLLVAIFVAVFSDPGLMSYFENLQPK